VESDKRSVEKRSLRRVTPTIDEGLLAFWPFVSTVEREEEEGGKRRSGFRRMINGLSAFSLNVRLSRARAAPGGLISAETLGNASAAAVATAVYDWPSNWLFSPASPAWE